MKLLKSVYESIAYKKAPYYFKYSLFTIISKPIRKFFSQVIAPNCPFNNLRIMIYRLCGFKIGKHTFIGMKCYLDDMCYDLLKIGNNVTISYGVYFACHGKKQGHYPIVVEDDVYIGMRANMISKNGGTSGITVGRGAIVGACSLVNCNVPANSTAVGIPCRVVIHGPTLETRRQQYDEMEVLQSCSDSYNGT